MVEWSANMMEEDAKRRLKSAELQAKKDRLKIWTNYVPPQTNSTAILDVNFSGKVTTDSWRTLVTSLCCLCLLAETAIKFPFKYVLEHLIFHSDRCVL